MVKKASHRHGCFPLVSPTQKKVYIVAMWCNRHKHHKPNKKAESCSIPNYKNTAMIHHIEYDEIIAYLDYYYSYS
jgi:hypothetical protein